YCPFKRLVLLSSPFSFQSAVADLPLTCLLSPLSTQLFCCIFCMSRCFDLFVRTTATLLTVYLLVFSLLNGRWLVLFVLACSSLSYQNRFQYNRYLRSEEHTSEL